MVLPRAYPSYLRGFNSYYQRRNVVLTLVNHDLDEIDIPYGQLTDLMYDHDYDKYIKPGKLYVSHYVYTRGCYNKLERVY